MRLLTRAACLALVAAWLPAPAAEAERTLVTDGYRLEVSVAFHKALLHWMDSLADLHGVGFTAGKTVPLHRAEFQTLWGALSGSDRHMLTRYHQARLALADAAPAGERDRLTLAFFDAAGLSQALERTADLGEARFVSDLTRAIDHFDSRYQRVWKEGRVAEGFLERALAAPRRGELAQLLARTARFLGVSPAAGAAPQLVLVPVPGGQGTHAQAIGRYLLIEVRDGESLEDEVAPIVHENVHFLFQNIPAERREALERTAVGAAAHGGVAWGSLIEALPTAIGQGLAGRTFLGEEWSLEAPWYHLGHVDAYAKRIFPLVDAALRDGATFDEAFVRRLVDAHPQAASAGEAAPRTDATGRVGDSSPRSP